MGTQTFTVRDASRMAAVREEYAERLWIYHILPVLTHTQPSPIKQELDLDDVTGI